MTTWLNRRGMNLIAALLAVLFTISGGLMAGGVSAQGEPVTLTMSAWDVATTPYWQAVIDAYEAANPNVTIELVDLPSADYQDVMNIRLSGGDDTDIITVKDIPGYSAMLTRNQIIPLNEYIERDGLDLSVYSGAAEELTYEGSIYGLPFRSDIWILFYNKAIFDAAGVEYPDNDMTWAEFDALARQLTSGSGADKIYGAHFHVWRFVCPVGDRARWLEFRHRGRLRFMAPMYEMVTAMQKDGIVMDYGELESGNIHYSGPFINGQVAMIPMGSWFIGRLVADQAAGIFDFPWGVAAFPHPEGVEPGTTAGTLTSLAINEKSDNKDAAWDFIKFYAGEEGAKVLAETSNLPALRTPEVLEILPRWKAFPAEATEALQTTTVRLEPPCTRAWARSSRS